MSSNNGQDEFDMHKDEFEEHDEEFEQVEGDGGDQFPMHSDEDEEYNEGDEAHVSIPDNLEYVSKMVVKFQALQKIEDVELKFHLLDSRLAVEVMDQGMDIFKVLSLYMPQDTTYNALLNRIAPKIAKNIQPTGTEHTSATLATLLGMSFVNTLWFYISQLADKKGLQPSDFGLLCQQLDKTPVYYNGIGDLTPFTLAVASDVAEYPDCTVSDVINEVYPIYEAIKTGVVEEATPVKPEVEPVQEEPEQEQPQEGFAIDGEGYDSMELDSIVKDILNIYDSLYQPCFVNRPEGILTSEGVLAFNDKGQPAIKGRGVKYAKGVYEIFANASQGYLPNQTSNKMLDSSFINRDGTLADVYSPVYHLRNIFGITDTGEQIQDWGKFRAYLEKDLENKLASVMTKASDLEVEFQLRLKALFTNCIIVDTLDRVTLMRLTFRVEGLPNTFGKNLAIEAPSKLATSTGVLINDSVDDLSVRNILYVFDSKAYLGEILFSYKAQERLIASGVRPSAKSVLLGRGIDGRDVTENLDAPGNIIIGIIAGTRSGKGVLTLNILASLYSANCPVFYLDYKPDMAATLWNLERDLNNQGFQTNIFSVDAKELVRKDSGKLAKPTRGLDLGRGIPEGLKLSHKDAAIIAYAKAMQFSCLLATLRVRGLIEKKEKVFFVLDEAQQANAQLGATLNYLVDFTKARKNKDESLMEYAERFIEVFYQDLYNRMTGVVRTDGGSGLVGYIMLGQQVDPGHWALNGAFGNWEKSPIGYLAGNMSIKLIGRDSGKSDKYGRPKFSYNGDKYKEEMGYWLKHRGSVAPTNQNDFSVLKSYLVLNENDFDPEAYENGTYDKNSFTGSLLKNITDETIRQTVVSEEFVDPRTGQVRESIGFSGLMKLLMGGDNTAELSQRMSRGYNLMWEVFEQMGLSQRYSTLEEYLYDGSLDSFFTVSELEQMFISGGVDNPTTESETDGVDWFGSQNTASTNTQEVIDGYEDPYGNPLTANESPQGVPVGSGSTQTVSPEAYNNFYDEEEGTPNGQVSSESWENQGTWGTPESQAQVQAQAQGGQSNQQNFNPYQDYHSGVVDATNAPTPNKTMHYSSVYEKELNIPDEVLAGFQGGVLSNVTAQEQASKLIQAELLRVFGTFDAVEVVELTSTGLVINDIAIRPKFPKEVIEALPYAVQIQVSSGNIIELFNFKSLLKYRNLMVLQVDNARMAEGRLRRELGIAPKKDWTAVFKRLKRLQKLIIQGAVITDSASAETYADVGAGKGVEIKEKLSEKFQLPTNLITSSHMEKIWRSTPVKITTGALGWTLGVKAVTVAASLFGPWGLLFGAFAGYGAYKKFKENRNR